MTYAVKVTGFQGNVQAFFNGVTGSLEDGILIWQEIERSVIESLPYWRSGYRRARFTVAVVVVLAEMIMAWVERDVERCSAPQQALSSDVQVQSTVEPVTEALEPISKPINIDPVSEAPLPDLEELFTAAAAMIAPMTDRDFVVMAKAKRYPRANKWAYTKKINAELMTAIVAYQGL